MPDLSDFLPQFPWEGPPIPRGFPSPFGLTDEEITTIKSQIQTVIERENLPRPHAIFIVGSFARGNAWIGTSDLDILFYFPELETFYELSEMDDKYSKCSYYWNAIAEQYGAKSADWLVTNALKDRTGRGIERAAEGYEPIRR